MEEVILKCDQLNKVCKSIEADFVSAVENGEKKIYLSFVQKLIHWKEKPMKQNKILKNWKKWYPYCKKSEKKLYSKRQCELQLLQLFACFDILLRLIIFHLLPKRQLLVQSQEHRNSFKSPEDLLKKLEGETYLGGHCGCQIFKKREKKKCIKSKMQIAVLKKKVLSQMQSQQFLHTRANLYYLETWTKSNNDSCTSLKNNLVWNFLCSLYRLSVYFAESNNTLAIFCSIK